MSSQLNLNNIQGDILSGLSKKSQSFVFFQITNAATFKAHLKEFVPHIKTVAQVVKDRQAIQDHKKQVGEAEPDKIATLLPIAGVNIAFSKFGLQKLGITDNSGDQFFEQGQLKDSQQLGDPGSTVDGQFKPAWDEAFLKAIDGVFLIAADSHASINKEVVRIEKTFGVHTHHASFKEVKTVRGDVRPDPESGHEHFGFKDGISNPSVEGFDTPIPGDKQPKQVPPSSILLGQDGSGPAWTKDGSFLVFRYLFQHVPEFNEFLKNNPVDLRGLPRDKGSELLGARMVGRWKSGAPIDITPLMDDKDLANDPNRNNNFDFDGEIDNQTRCPFAAHIRKTFPRSDFAPLGDLTFLRIARRGIPFGPELSDSEKHSGKTEHDRGLLFVSYQAQINAFHTIQHTWANNQNFEPGAKSAVPGLDPIIGQNGGADRTMSGVNPQDTGKNLSMPNFVITRGGEYFFSPSLKALTESFS